MMAMGEDHGRAKLTIWDVAAIKLLLAEPSAPPMTHVARAFGVNPPQVQRIRKGECWGWLRVGNQGPSRFQSGPCVGRRS